MSIAICRALTVTGLVLLVATAAQAQSVSSVLEQYGLLGTFAIDCSSPASPKNHYTVFRALDTNRVQIDLMVGPTTRQYAYIIDRASGAGPNGVATSMANEKQRLNLVYRVEGKRLRTMDSTREGGPTIITGGNFAHDGAPTTWLNKCA